MIFNDLVVDVAAFLDLTYARGFFPTIFKPTCITDHTSTPIDKIFVNTPLFSQSGLITVDLSDHLPIYVIMNSQSMRQIYNSNVMNKQYFRTYNSDVFKNINKAPSAIYWDNFTEFPSVNEDYDYFMHRVVSTLNNIAPIKEKISKTINKRPWITAGLLKSCTYRQKLFSRA